MPSGPPAAALVSPVSPPHFPGQQTLIHREISPLLPLALAVSESLLLLVFISVLGKQRLQKKGYDLGREA